MRIIIYTKNNLGLKKFLTLSIFKKMHFFSISGCVPKIALTIYMRGDKKS
jgi:hypothetical protein